MKRLLAGVLLLALLLAGCVLVACEQKTTGPKTEYVLPAEITQGDGYGGYTSYKLSYNGNELRISSIDGSYRLLCCDSTGKITKETNYTPNGKERSTTVYEYDENGNLTEKRTQERNGSTLRDVYTYDKRGNQLSWRSYGYGGESDHWYESTYDENGNELTRLSYNADGTLASRLESVYDEHGNEVTWRSYDGNGKERARNEYTYDEHGLQRTWTRFDGGAFSFRQEYSHDENGNCTQVVRYVSEEECCDAETYVYDENGVLIEYTVYDSEGVPSIRSLYTYDERGNITEEAIFRPPETLIETYLYSFDDYGYPTGRTVQYADGSEKVSWQVTETVTALASEVQLAFYRSCMETYAIPMYTR